MRLMCLLFFLSLPFLTHANDSASEDNVDSSVTTLKEPNKNNSKTSEKAQSQQSAKSFLSRPVGSSISTSSVGSQTPVIGSSNIVSMLLSLLLVIVLIFVLAWFMRRVGGNTMLGGQSMKVVAALSLGAKEKLMLVDVAGEQILLGVTSAQISHIKTFDEAVVESTNGGAGDFSNKFRSFLVKHSEGKAENISEHAAAEKEAHDK